jgi:hypothetical protein
VREKVAKNRVFKQSLRTFLKKFFQEIFSENFLAFSITFCLRELFLYDIFLVMIHRLFLYSFWYGCCAASLLVYALATAPIAAFATMPAVVQRSDSSDAMPTLGLLISAPLTRYAGRFGDLPASTSAPTLAGTDSASSLGFMIGLAAETPLHNSSVFAKLLQSWNVRLPWERLRLGMQADVQIWEANLFVNDAPQRATARLTLSSIGFTPTVRYATGLGALDVQAGLRLAFTARASFERSVVSSSGATISDSGLLTNFNSFQPSLVLRLLYTLPMDAAKTVILQPEISYQQPLSAVSVDATSWGAGLPRFRAGATLNFNAAVLDAYRDREIARQQRDTIFQRDTAVVLIASAMPPHIQRTSRTVQAPSQPRPREMETLVSVASKMFSGQADSAVAPVQTEVIVRESYLREVPKPKPLITATTDAEFIMPDGRKEKRVKVKAEKTLVRVHTAPPDVAATLPQMAVFKDSTMKPYVIADTLFTSRLPRMRFFPRIISEADITAWHLEILQRGRVVAEFGGSGTEVESLAERGVDWDPSAEPDNLIRANQQLAYRLRVTDADQQTMIVDSGLIKVEREEGVLAGVVQRTVEVVVLEGAFGERLEANEQAGTKALANAKVVADSTHSMSGASVGSINASGTEAASQSARTNASICLSERDERLLAAVRSLVKPHSLVRLTATGIAAMQEPLTSRIKQALATNVATALSVPLSQISVVLRPALNTISASHSTDATTVTNTTRKAAARRSLTVVIETM